MVAQARCVRALAACAATATGPCWPATARVMRSTPCSRTPHAVDLSPPRHALRAYVTISELNDAGSLCVEYEAFRLGE